MGEIMVNLLVWELKTYLMWYWSFEDERFLMSTPWLGYLVTVWLPSHGYIVMLLTNCDLLWRHYDVIYVCAEIIIIGKAWAIGYGSCKKWSMTFCSWSHSSICSVIYPSSYLWPTFSICPSLVTLKLTTFWASLMSKWLGLPEDVTLLGPDTSRSWFAIRFPLK